MSRVAQTRQKRTLARARSIDRTWQRSNYELFESLEKSVHSRWRERKERERERERERKKERGKERERERAKTEGERRSKREIKR